MPARRGSAAEIRRRYAAIVNRTTGANTRAAMALTLSIGMTEAKKYTPIGYGDLMRSAYRRINLTPSGFQGVGGFSGGISNPPNGTPFNYGKWLHETTNWSPRHPSRKKAPAWNAQATPKFLERGFTDSSSLELMKRALRDSYRL